MNCSIVMVWGITGMYALFAPHREAELPPILLKTLAYTPKKGATDREVAQDVFALVKPPLAGKLPALSTERDAQNHLVVKFYRPGTVLDATVLEQQGQVRVEQHLSSLTEYVSDMHQVSMVPERQALSLRLWSYYTELSIWSLLAMAISGILMWLLSRPRHRMAQICFGTGIVVFCFLFAMVR